MCAPNRGLELKARHMIMVGKSGYRTFAVLGKLFGFWFLVLFMFSGPQKPTLVVMDVRQICTR